MADHDEILRLRNRMHDIEAELIGFKYLLDDLREWRKRADRKLEDLVKADELAEAVAQKLNEGTTQKLTQGTFNLDRWQVRIAGGGLALAIAIAVAGGLKALVGG